MSENLKTQELTAAKERLTKFTEHTEPISFKAYQNWGMSGDSIAIYSHNNFLFDKCVREMQSQENLIFSSNGALVIPNPEKKNQNSQLFQDMMTLIGRDTQKFIQRINKAIEIIYLDAKKKENLIPAELAFTYEGNEKWRKKLGINFDTPYRRNPGYILSDDECLIGFVLTEERRKIIAENGQLKKSYLEQIKVYHPDVNNGEYATRQSQRINEAFSILSSSQNFIQYQNDL
jgi:hypothetical protein